MTPHSNNHTNGDPAMKDYRAYMDEIRQNVEKMRAQGQVTTTENALFGMIDGLAGLNLLMLDQLADVKTRLREIETAQGISR
jgi:type II secretory pathway component PulM